MSKPSAHGVDKRPPRRYVNILVKFLLKAIYDLIINYFNPYKDLKSEESREIQLRS